jgi:hypothetical protein
MGPLTICKSFHLFVVFLCILADWESYTTPRQPIGGWREEGALTESPPCFLLVAWESYITTSRTAMHFFIGLSKMWASFTWFLDTLVMSHFVIGLSKMAMECRSFFSHDFGHLCADQLATKETVSRDFGIHFCSKTWNSSFLQRWCFPFLFASVYLVLINKFHSILPLEKCSRILHRYSSTLLTHK